MWACFLQNSVFYRQHIALLYYSSFGWTCSCSTVNCFRLLSASAIRKVKTALWFDWVVWSTECFETRLFSLALSHGVSVFEKTTAKIIAMRFFSKVEFTEDALQHVHRIFHHWRQQPLLTGKVQTQSCASVSLRRLEEYNRAMCEQEHSVEYTSK